MRMKRQTSSSHCSLLFLCGWLVAGISNSWAADELGPSYPNIPPDYEVLHAGSLIADARVDFPAYVIGRTNGYQVTAPSGAQFVVNSITQPKCAFYATYVGTDENGHLNAGTGNNPAVVSNVYVGEVNFDKCQ